jgi:hypothetical protein
MRQQSDNFPLSDLAAVLLVSLGERFAALERRDCCLLVLDLILDDSMTVPIALPALAYPTNYSAHLSPQAPD